MKIAAIIAEYNPFHNGHRAQVAATRQAGATHLVAVMGGNFLQRGEAALFEKRERARAALLGGVDLVLELPLCYAVATAERFAYGAVATLGALGVVDVLSFGSESGSLPKLQALARALESEAFPQALRRELGEGDAFARARQRAVAGLLGVEEAALLEGANNTLGVEYLRQLLRQELPIQPMTVERLGAAHDGETPAGAYASASLIRKLWREEPGLALPYLPQTTHQVLTEGMGPVNGARLEVAQLSHLRRLTPRGLASCPDVSEGLEHRLYAAIRAGTTLEEILALAKTKRYPLARLRRILLAAFLELPGEPAHRSPPYIYVLGYNRRGAEVLAAARKRAALPISDSLARLRAEGERAEELAHLQALATDLYTAALPRPLPCGYEYTAPPVRLL